MSPTGLHIQEAIKMEDVMVMAGKFGKTGVSIKEPGKMMLQAAMEDWYMPMEGSIRENVMVFIKLIEVSFNKD